MDSEDRDHFKTIAGAQVGQQGGSPRNPNKDASDSDHYLTYCLRQAETIFGSYRRDEANSPETYAAAIAAVLTLYSKAVVDDVADPRTGIASHQKFLPNVFEVREFCTKTAERLALQAKPSIKPKSGRYEPMGSWVRWNLFIGNDILGYDKMVDRAKAAKHEYYKYDSNYKGTGRAGIWVPSEWWEERHAKNKIPDAELKSPAGSAGLSQPIINAPADDMIEF